jgi:hypothetical protein
MPKRIEKFVAEASKAGVTELSEGGKSPIQYGQEWKEFFLSGVEPNMAFGATVSLEHPEVADYPGKGARTIVDGMPGFNDFSYNYLCFYGESFSATIDLGAPVRARELVLRFLDDPRHWIFPPVSLSVQVSSDGIAFKDLPAKGWTSAEEHFEVGNVQRVLPLPPGQSVKMIRVNAMPLPALPSWRPHARKKPMIATDEVYLR